MQSTHFMANACYEDDRRTRRARKNILEGKTMKMKVIGDKFYVAEVGEDKWIHDSRDEGIETLKEEILKNPDLLPGDTRLIEVDTSTEKWNLKMVPWEEIAVELIRGGEVGGKRSKG